jgi:hypothetical protein
VVGDLRLLWGGKRTLAGLTVFWLSLPTLEPPVNDWTPMATLAGSPVAAVQGRAAALIECPSPFTLGGDLYKLSAQRHHL